MICPARDNASSAVEVVETEMKNKRKKKKTIMKLRGLNDVNMCIQIFMSIKNLTSIGQKTT